MQCYIYIYIYIYIHTHTYSAAFLAFLAGGCDIANGGRGGK